MSDIHVKLDISSISLVLAVLGFYITFVGQFSYWLKEKLFISSALISLCVGIAVGPIGANWISPWVWTDYDDNLRNEVTYQFCRLIIGIQVMFAGISLPAAYLYREWKSLSMLLLPIMTLAWFVSAGFILLFIPNLTFLEALCISAAVTPTDPILANAIVKGRYAEKHVPRNVRYIISAESGANDGLGYPFIYLPILLMRRSPTTAIHTVLSEWVVETWFYQIFLAIFLGFLIGFIGRKTLKEAHKRQLIDHESFLAYGVGLAFLVLGVVGVLGSDDVLAAFVAGNSLTWRDFYRVENQDDTFQDTLDSLLNASIFLYVGSLIPWSEFNSMTTQISPWRLVLLALCILIFRRLPFVLIMYRWIPALEDRKQALFAGHFGPIGVSALYYAMVALRELPPERVLLREVVVPVVLFIVLSSTVVHGITIPLTKFGPKALTRTRSSMSLASTNANHYFNKFRNHRSNNNSDLNLSHLNLADRNNRSTRRTTAAAIRITTEDISAPLPGTDRLSRGIIISTSGTPTTETEGGNTREPSRRGSFDESILEPELSELELEMVEESEVGGDLGEGNLRFRLDSLQGCTSSSSRNTSKNNTRTNSIIIEEEERKLPGGDTSEETLTPGERGKENEGELGGSGNQLRVEFVLP